MKKLTINRKAFTLVELSIVIVIMGLLVAATISGKELLNIAKLKSVISEVESYKVAVDNFKTQYEALPGDMPNATSFGFFGNGNNDGWIGEGAIDKTEPYYAWNHLTVSKFIPGTFSGNSAAFATIGVNSPASKHMDGVGFSISMDYPYDYVDSLARYYHRNYIRIGKNSASHSLLLENSLMPSDAYYIDSKTDDGAADSGKVLGGPGSSGGACTTGVAPNIIYDLSQATIECSISFSIE